MSATLRVQVKQISEWVGGGGGDWSRNVKPSFFVF